MQELAYILVGDHLGQVKRVLWPTCEVSSLPGFGTPSSSNPIVSIEAISGGNTQLIARKEGQLYIYDCIQDKTTECQSVDDNLIKALPVSSHGNQDKILYVYEKQLILDKHNAIQSTKKDLKGEIKNAKLLQDQIAVVGKDISLKVFDINKKVRLFDAEPPEKDWLGIRPETYVSGIDYIANHPNRLGTCSKSDSVIRVYDTKSNSSKPVISININQTAFNEHADSARFISLASAQGCSASQFPIVVGSNVGQILAIDVRFNIKQTGRKAKNKFQPKTYKILGGFKGSRGASIKDVKVIADCSSRTHLDEDIEGNNSDNDPSDSSEKSKVISCSLDRYMRVHNFNRRSRNLDKHIFLTTKPTCCSAVFYNN